MRPEHRVVTDIDMRIVHESKSKIRINIIAEMAVTSAEIGMERRFKITALTNLGKHLFQQCLSLLSLSRTSVVEIVKAVKALCLPLHDFLVIR